MPDFLPPFTTHTQEEKRMSELNRRDRNIGFITFFLSGICTISAGIIISILQEKYSLTYSTTGSLLSFMSAGSMSDSFLSGILPRKLGVRKTVLILTAGYFIGYLLTAFIGLPGVLIAAFLMIGMAKGCALNRCTVLVGNNSADRPRGLQIMHACYAMGALLCPFLITALSSVDLIMPMLGVALCGLVFWGVYVYARLPRKQTEKEKTAAPSSHGFLRSPLFWLLAALLFCQNGAETSVTGWLVTYYRNQNILSGALSSYTMTIMWGATLIARLLIAFVVPIKNQFKALFLMGVCCTVLYAILVPIHASLPAIMMLFAFAFAMAGVNPMSTACLGKQISQESMAVLLPLGSAGAILMPLIIGLVADHAGLQAGMMMNLIPCAGIAVFSGILWHRNSKKNQSSAS